jgi:hypothetical protein
MRGIALFVDRIALRSRTDHGWRERGGDALCLIDDGADAAGSGMR